MTMLFRKFVWLMSSPWCVLAFCLLDLCVGFALVDGGRLKAGRGTGLMLGCSGLLGYLLVIEMGTVLFRVLDGDTRRYGIACLLALLFNLAVLGMLLFLSTR